MSESMLETPHQLDPRRSMRDLEEKLAGPDGTRWLSALNRFLHKENPWRGGVKPETVSAERWRTVNATTIEVNFDAQVQLPSDQVTVEWNWNTLVGWVVVERVGEDVYVGGLKVDFYLDREQKTRPIPGDHMRLRLRGIPVLDPRIREALLDNQHLLPHSWRLDADGNVRHINFFAVGFRGLHSSCVYVQSMFWHDGMGWIGNMRGTDGCWTAQHPAAVRSDSRSGSGS